MSPKDIFSGFTLLCVTTALASCGGSSNGEPNDGVAGIGGTGITTSGTITGFGSIFVNGIEFETESASVSLDDNPGTESDLGLGMVVTVSGTLNSDGITGTADSVIFDDEVQGPISNIEIGPDGLTKTLIVLGINVQVDEAKTIFNDVSFDTLSVGDVIEVSGFADNNGTLQATRIEKKETFIPGLSEVELKGSVTNLDGTTFVVGGFTVEFGSADLSDIPGGVVTNDMQVEVKGSLSGNVITATRVKKEDDLFDENVDKVSLEGIITNFVSDSSFSVAGQSVNASGAILEPESLVLSNGLEVEVEGPIVNGILQAVKVEARGGNVKLEASVASVDTSAGTIVLQFVPGNLTVHVNSQTSMRDDLDVFSTYTINNVSAGDFLEVTGFIDGDNKIIANEIRRDDSDDDILQGPADSCTAGSSVEVLGLSFTLVDGTTSYEDQNDNALANSSDFCNAVNSNPFFVKVKDDEGSRNGIADEAELEN